MLIAITADSHDNIENTKKAINLITKKGCTMLLFAGDLIAPTTLKYFFQFPGDIHMILGNNDGEKIGLTRKIDMQDNATLHGDVFEETLDGMRIHMNHYPRQAEIAAQSGLFDLVIHGHTHQYREEMVGETLLLNPGSIYGYPYTASIVLFDTNTKEVEKVGIQV